jgi:methionine-rich copper-binding protein CopC
MQQFISLTVTSFFLLFGFAFAHSDLVSSTPVNGAVLSEAPKEILLTFENDIEADFSIFKVYPLSIEVTDVAAFVPTVISLQGDEDARVDTGVIKNGGDSVIVSLEENLAPGAYVAMFKILAGDTHAVEAFITFELQAAE